MTNRPHDALFKAGFANPAHIQGLYRGTYPAEICDTIDWSSVAPEPASFVDTKLDDGHTDLLFSARLHPSKAADRAQIYLYLLLEHLSTSDRWIPLRTYTYLERIFGHQRDKGIEPLAHVLPLVVTHAPGGWTGPRHFAELFRPPSQHIDALTQLTPQFEVTILDLSQMANDEIKDRALTVFAKLVLWLLRDGRNSEQLLSNLQHWEAAFIEALQSPFGVAAVARLLRYVYEVTEGLSYQRFCATIHERIPQAERVNMTMAEELMQQGRLEGRLEGQLEGRLEGRRSVLEKQLLLKFGGLDVEYRQRLSNASEEQLLVYAERVLTADSLEAVFAHQSGTAP